MTIKVLTSGSKANSSLIESNEKKILIDIGATFPYIMHALEEVHLSPHDIDGVFITHTHSDHIRGLASFVKKTGIQVYAPRLMMEDLRKIIPPDQLVEIEDHFLFGDLTFDLIHTSHDAIGSVGYVITCGQKSLLYITDTGYLHRKYFSMMKNHNIYYMESNHDEQMLMNGPYPYYLKQRIISDEGHLSNHTAASYLAQLIGENTEFIILAHLSEKNNTEEMARLATEEALKATRYHPEILIAKPLEPLERVEV